MIAIVAINGTCAKWGKNPLVARRTLLADNLVCGELPRFPLFEGESGARVITFIGAEHSNKSVRYTNAHRCRARRACCYEAQSVCLAIRS